MGDAETILKPRMLNRFKRILTGGPQPIDEGTLRMAVAEMNATERLLRLRRTARTEEELVYQAYIQFESAAGVGIHSDEDRWRWVESYLALWKAASRIDADAVTEQLQRVGDARQAPMSVRQREHARLYSVMKDCGLVIEPPSRRGMKSWADLTLADKDNLSVLLPLSGLAVAVAAPTPAPGDAVKTLVELLPQTTVSSSSEIVRGAAQSVNDNPAGYQELDTSRETVLAQADRARTILEDVRVTDRRQFHATVLTIMGRLGNASPDEAIGRDRDFTAAEFLEALDVDVQWFVEAAKKRGERAVVPRR